MMLAGPFHLAPSPARRYTAGNTTGGPCVTEPTDLVTAKKVLEQTEAIRLKAFLDSEGIRCDIVSYHDSSLDGISQDPGDEHWGEIRVLARDVERATQIIADVEASAIEDEPEG
jgi:hypothetical protein